MKNAALSFKWLFLPTCNSVAAKNVLINCIASIILFIRINGASIKQLDYELEISTIA